MGETIHYIVHPHIYMYTTELYCNIIYGYYELKPQIDMGNACADWEMT